MTAKIKKLLLSGILVGAGITSLPSWSAETPSVDTTILTNVLSGVLRSIKSLVSGIFPSLAQVAICGFVLFLAYIAFIEIKKYFIAAGEPIHFDGMDFQDENDLNDYLYSVSHYDEDDYLQHLEDQYQNQRDSPGFWSDVEELSDLDGGYIDDHGNIRDRDGKFVT